MARAASLSLVKRAIPLAAPANPVPWRRFASRPTTGPRTTARRGRVEAPLTAPQHGDASVTSAVAARTALVRLDAIDSALSASVRLPGTPLRFGWDTALGRIPFAGAVAHSAVGAYALATAWQFRASPLLLAQLAANLAIDGAVRAIPLVGPWLAPSFGGSAARSVALLRAHIAKAAALPTVAPEGTAVAAGTKEQPATVKRAGGWGPLRAVAWGVSAVTWPLRHMSLAVLLAVVVLLPLTVWLGAVGFAVYTVIRLLGIV